MNKQLDEMKKKNNQNNHEKEEKPFVKKCRENEK